MSRSPARPRPKLPWHEQMTLCVAATCFDSDGPCIVLAADRRQEGEWYGADIAFKFSWIASDWPALFAGNGSSAYSLLETYMGRLRDVRLTRDNVEEELRRGAEARKKIICDHHLQMRASISYDDFLAKGKEFFSEGTRTTLEYEIRELTLGCYVLAAGFIGAGPHLYTIHENGDVLHHDHFAAIGTGYVIAESVLYQREHRSTTTLENALYSVYEAMRLARIAPGVGEGLNMVIVSYPKNNKLRARVVKGDAFDILANHFDTFGPKKLPSHLPRFDPSVFGDLPFEDRNDVQADAAK